MWSCVPVCACVLFGCSRWLVEGLGSRWAEGSEVLADRGSVAAGPHPSEGLWLSWRPCLPACVQLCMVAHGGQSWSFGESQGGNGPSHTS